MISWAQRWSRGGGRWITDGVDLLFPPACRWCRAEGDLAVAGICSACLRKFTVDQPRCPRCGSIQARDASGCAACPAGQPPWDGLLVLGAYGDALREAILRVKRPGREDLVRALAGLLTEKHRGLLEAARLDGVAAVPLHWTRRLQRGSNTAEEIATAVARGLRLRVLAALARDRATPMQNELPAEKRAANVAGVFRVRTAVAGRRLLVVDDVVTTGATLDACCRALKAAGAVAVYAAALARADRLGETEWEQPE